MKCGVLVGGVLVLGDLVGAVRLSLLGRSSRSSLRRRGNLSAIGNSTLTNSADIQYTSKITLGGKEYQAMIDTGSADLWVADLDVPNTTDAGLTSSVTYAVGQASGPVKFAPLEFAGYTIDSQAFIEAPPDAQNAEGSGLIGLGPSDGSNIFQDMKQSVTGNPPVDNIFLQNLSAPNILTILLGRSDDPSDQFPGDLTVGETIPGYDDIVNQAKLPVTRVSTSSGTQHWQVLLDQNGITGPDGSVIPVTSGVKSTKNKKQATVVMDSGFTLPQVPKSVSDAIYGRFPGADLMNITGLGSVWVLPCTAEVNISFSFANKTYPVHPLDATLEPSALSLNNVTTSTGDDGCIGAFQPFSFSGATTYDIILGMAFLRNAYMLTNYGDFLEGTTNKGDPYLQLLSTTNDTAEAHSDFVNVRLGGVDTTGTTQLTAAKATPSDTSSGSSNSIFTHRTFYIIVGGAVAGILLLAVAAIIIGRLRRRNRYQSLNNPAPAAATDMYMAAPPGPPVYHPGAYGNPFDHQRR
jgi:hypothetical protein